MRKLISLMSVLLLCGCVHKTLLDGTQKQKELVKIYVTCTNVRHAEEVASARFALSNLYGTPDGQKGVLFVPATVHGVVVSGYIECYGHTQEQGACEHTLTILLTFPGETEKGMAVDVSSQMLSQRGSTEIHITIDQEIVPEQLIDYVVDSDGGIQPMEPDDNIDIS